MQLKANSASRSANKKMAVVALTRSELVELIRSLCS